MGAARSDLRKGMVGGRGSGSLRRASSGSGGGSGGGGRVLLHPGSDEFAQVCARASLRHVAARNPTGTTNLNEGAEAKSVFLAR